MSIEPGSDLAQLLQRLKETEHRLALQQKRADDADRRAENELRSRLEAESRAQIESDKNRSTTFEEYIRACHTHLSMPLRIQRDKRLGTKGSITNIKNMYCPTLLKPWRDFPKLQQQLFERIQDIIPRDSQLFSSTQHLTELGMGVCDRPLASEKDLEYYERAAVEKQIETIISRLQLVEEARLEFNLGDGLIFENHANTLSDHNEFVQESLQALSKSRKGQASNPKPRSADQICVYKKADGTKHLRMVVEYKAPHKLSVFNLRAGLSRADNGSMNIPKDVINRITIPTDPEEKFIYHSEWLTTAALTQTYTYMIENGLKYSKIATGEASIFLLVKEGEPHTLYYHLAEPNIEAEAQIDIDLVLCRTAVSQTLAFSLMASNSEPRDQKWRNHTLETACRAVIDHKSILQRMPSEEEEAMTPPSSVFQARIHPFVRSPIVLRSRKVRNSCADADVNVYEDPKTPSESSDEASDAEITSTPSVRIRQSDNAKKNSSRPTRANEESDQQYCTQACLLGLARALAMDRTCPNFSAHLAYAGEVGNDHALGRESFVTLMSLQLARDPGDGCEALGKQGACGALFRLTLRGYGYTFVAKGTVMAYTAKLKHEGSVYRLLDEVQGEIVPVYLGNIDLVRPYYLDFNVKIVHMLLMSWAGEQVCEDLFAMERDLVVETNRAATKLLSYGVEHGDVRLPNVLWNPEIKKVMLVDFERSTVSKSILQDKSPNRVKKEAVLQKTWPGRKRKYFCCDPHVSCQCLSGALSI